MKIVVRYKIELYLSSGQTVRMEAAEYEFRTTGGTFTGYTFNNQLQKVSVNPTAIVGHKVTGKTYRLS